MIRTALVVSVLLMTAAARADEPKESSSKIALRPYEAPLYATPPELPPLPPEYLQHDAEGIRFAYHPSARERVRVLIEEADKVRAELRAQLAEELLQSIDVRVAVEGADLERVVPVNAPQGSGVVALSQLSLLALSLSSSSGSKDALAAFRRGMAFLALDEASDARGLPRWFRIGHALHFSGQATLGRARSLWWASMQDQLIPLADLDWYLSDRAAYSSVAAAQSADFVRFTLETEGAFRDLLSQVSAGKSFGDGLRAAYQADPEALELSWREEVARHRAFVPVLAGSTALWLLVAVAVALRRRSTKRKRRGERESRPAQVRIVKIARKLDPAHMPETEMPEVPKVSHNGRWHTLH